jgi:hypothetical protein
MRIIVKDTANSSIYGLNGLKYSNGFNDIINSEETIKGPTSIPDVFLKLDLSL